MGPQELCVEGYKLTEEGCEVTGLQWVREFIGIDATPYSGWRAFSHSEGEAGVPHSRRQAHLGNGAG